MRHTAEAEAEAPIQMKSTAHSEEAGEGNIERRRKAGETRKKERCFRFIASFSCALPRKMRMVDVVSAREWLCSIYHARLCDSAVFLCSENGEKLSISISTNDLI